MNNPAAFPIIETAPDGSQSIETGMTLRDYFAAAVFPAVYKEFWSSHRAGEFELCDTWPTGLARDAYRIADAMLAEREKGANK